MDAIGFDNWSDTGINLRNKNTGILKTTCPQCSDTRKAGNRKDPCLSVNFHDSVFNCHNCEWNGYVKTGGKKGVLPSKPSQYVKPEFVYQEPSEKMYAFWEGRKIKRETLQRFMIYPRDKWMAKLQAVVPVQSIPYFENSEIVNIKNRHDYYVEEDGQKFKKKAFSMEKDAKLVLYNIDSVKGKKKVIVVEGEPDTWAGYQALEDQGAEEEYGIISVPNGASKGDIKMEYLDGTDQLFADVEEFVIATDGDEVGQVLRDELVRRLGRHRCKMVEWPEMEGVKMDSNEALKLWGEIGLFEIYTERAYPPPIEGIITVEDVQAEMDYIREHGYPKGAAIGFPQFDKLLTFRGGEVTTITGIPSHGKSEFLDEIHYQLSKRHGWRHGIFAHENGGARLHFIRMCHRYGGLPVYNPTGIQLSDHQYLEAKCFVNEHNFLIDTRKTELKLPSLLEKARILVQEKGIKSFTFDPYNCIESSRPSNMSETEWVSEIYAKLVMFAEDYDTHVFLVAHPTKMPKNDDGIYVVPTMYNISGSANFYNKTFNGIAIYRDFAANITQAHIQKVKFDFVGEPGLAEFVYSKETRRYRELGANLR